MGAKMGTANCCVGEGRKEAEPTPRSAAPLPKLLEPVAACTAPPPEQSLNPHLPAPEPEPESPGDPDASTRSSTMEEPAAEPSREATAVALESAVPEAVPEVAPQAVVNDAQAQKRDDYPCMREAETPAQAENDAAAETVDVTVRKDEQGASKPKSNGRSKGKTAKEERRQKALAKAKPVAKGKEGGNKKRKTKANADGK